MPGTPQRPNDFSCSYEPTTAAIPAARTAFCAWLAEHVHDDDLHDEMAVVLSELVANAVDATEVPSGHVSVRAWVDSGGLTVEVTNPPAATFAADVPHFWGALSPPRSVGFTGGVGRLRCRCGWGCRAGRGLGAVAG